MARSGRRPAGQSRGRDRRPIARRRRGPGWSRWAETADLGATPLWTRVNALESPWVLDDLVTLVTEIGDVLDVVMVPKVEGPWDIHYVDRLLAQLEARAGLDAADPRPRDPRDRAGRGQRRGDRQRLAAHAGHLARPGRPRGVAADEDHARRRRASRATACSPTRTARRAAVLPAGPLALHDRPHGRRLRRGRHLPVLRPVRRHQGRRGLRGPVPRRLPDGLRRHVVAAPGPDRDRQAGLLARARRGRSSRARCSRRSRTAAACT